jgi:hypothetical protein
MLKTTYSCSISSNNSMPNFWKRASCSETSFIAIPVGPVTAGSSPILHTKTQCGNNMAQWSTERGIIKRIYLGIIHLAAFVA